MALHVHSGNGFMCLYCSIPKDIGMHARIGWTPSPLPLPSMPPPPPPHRSGNQVCTHIADMKFYKCFNGPSFHFVLSHMKPHTCIHLFGMAHISVCPNPPLHSSSSSPASPGPPVGLTVSSTSVDQLTVTWTPPTTGGVPTSYNVSINDSSKTLVPIPANGALQNTFTGLISNTLYTVSVVAINCAGTSSVTSAFGRTG